MKKKNTFDISKDYIIIFFMLGCGLLFVFLNSFGSLGFLRNGISYVFEPISYEATKMGTGTKEYLEAFSQLSSFRKEYNDMKTRVSELEIENLSYISLQNENDALKKQITLGNLENKYVMANVVRDSDIDFLLLDKGENEGIHEGDIVVLGNMFVGIVIKVDKEGCQVRLGTSNSSHLEVAVFKENSNGKIITSGVASGSAQGILVENMSMNSSVSDGDVVFVNDSRVGEFLVLGYLVGLSDNPATTSKSGYVSTIVDYDELTDVFVRVE